MGQEKAVTVTRFCVEGTIEEDLFQQIDEAAAKLEKRSNDSNYECENALMELNEEAFVGEEEDDVLLTDSISPTERIARMTADVKKHGQVIEILDDDDDAYADSNVSDKVTKVPLSNDTSSVVVKAETIISAASTAENTNANTIHERNSKKRAIESNTTEEKRLKQSSGENECMNDPDVQLPTLTPRKVNQGNSRMVSPTQPLAVPQEIVVKT